MSLHSIYLLNNESDKLIFLSLSGQKGGSEKNNTLIEWITGVSGKMGLDRAKTMKSWVHSVESLNVVDWKNKQMLM